MNKNELRDIYARKRASIPLSLVKAKSEEVISRLYDAPFYTRAKRIIFYAAIGNEVKTNEALKMALCHNKEVYLPKVCGDTLQIGRITNFASNTTVGAYGILEPIDIQEDAIALFEENDCIFVPGIMFTPQGNRIGYGKGYYDSLLTRVKGITIGLTFESQLHPFFETTPNDVVIQYLVTENRIIKPTGKILDGKKIASDILKELAITISKSLVQPRLAIILVGQNKESIMYTNIKKKRAEKIGMKATIYRFPAEITNQQLCRQIQIVSNECDGMIVQLPLPSHLPKQQILDCVPPSKDSDGLTTVNLGATFSGEKSIIPATPKAVMQLLDAYSISVGGKKVTIINSSTLVGKPLAMMLVTKGATVTLCHRQTRNLSEHTNSADILITAVGKPGLITTDMVKQNAVIIDVGITKRDDKILGDVDFENVKQKVAYITPVPGGIGPMTVASLLENVLNGVSKNL
jgi:methylenetetrahydrofolate dehydrogenase (NADP+) / methenyltetrahydrofolate cyclohydrolase